MSDKKTLLADVQRAIREGRSPVLLPERKGGGRRRYGQVFLVAQAAHGAISVIRIDSIFHESGETPNADEEDFQQLISV